MLNSIIIFTFLCFSFSILAQTNQLKKVTVVSSKGKYKSSVTKSPSTKEKPSTEKKPSASKLSTNIDFNDQTVGGKYQSPMEALSVVEDEKSIDDLIGVRKNFQDREERAKGMR